MKGEEWVWHKIAGRIGLSINKAKKQTTATQFLRWVQLFEDEWNEPDPVIYHLAQISYQLYLILFMFGGEPKKNIQDFVLKFQTEKPENTPETEEERNARLSASQQAWIGAVAAGMRAGSLRSDKPKKRRQGGKPLKRGKKK